MRPIHFQTARELCLKTKELCKPVDGSSPVYALLKRAYVLRQTLFRSPSEQCKSNGCRAHTSKAFWSHVGALHCLIEDRTLPDLALLCREGVRIRQNIMDAFSILDKLRNLDESMMRLPLVTLIFLLTHAAFVLKDGNVKYDDTLPDTVSPAAVCFAKRIRSVVDVTCRWNSGAILEANRVIKDSVALGSRWNSIFATTLVYDSEKMKQLYNACRTTSRKPSSLLEECLVNSKFDTEDNGCESWVTIADRLTRHQLGNNFFEANRSFNTCQDMSSIVEHESVEGSKPLAYIDFSCDETIARYCRCPYLQTMIYQVYAELREAAIILVQRARSLDHERYSWTFENGLSEVVRRSVQSLCVISIMLEEDGRLFETNLVKFLDICIKAK